MIQYTLGDGNDTIYGFNESSTLDIGDGNSASLTKSGDDMILKFGDHEILLAGAATLPNVNVRGMRDEILNITNSKNDTLIIGSGFADQIKNSGQNVTIAGNGGNDTIKVSGVRYQGAWVMIAFPILPITSA